MRHRPPSPELREDDLVVLDVQEGEPQARGAQAELINAVLELNRSSGRMTELVSVLRGLALNDVILTADVVLDSQGTYVFSAEVPFAGLTVSNRGPRPVIVASGTAGIGPPGPSPARFTVGPGRACTRPLTGTAFTVYGRPGADVGVSVWSHLQAPHEGWIAARPVTSFPLPGVSGLLGVQAGPLTGVGYHGFSVRETAGVSPVAFRVRDGAAAGTIADTVRLNPFESRAEFYGPDGLELTGDVYVELLGGGGTLEGSIRAS